MLISAVSYSESESLSASSSYGTSSSSSDTDLSSSSSSSSTSSSSSLPSSVARLKSCACRYPLSRSGRPSQRFSCSVSSSSSTSGSSSPSSSAESGSASLATIARLYALRQHRIGCRQSLLQKRPTFKLTPAAQSCRSSRPAL